ncbi:hypothetical protein Droror1_Dr00025057 [Drosera rotundifolia]
MNQYHIYEAIGHGKYSTVYKARKKKSIEYFAVKSVDKCHKSKVLQEVKILHDLDNPNILKFYAWYETSAHFWLVLEYCVGGDFMKLLQQDIQLPEDSIHDLAFDIVRALQFLHSKGIIYCDLKPSNILLDENGHTKLCDFGLARKLNDISEATSCSLPQSKRGTPCYMAPELFQDGGIHSYASDLWALGCVLYECFTGRPPFVGKEFAQLANSIISDPAPPLPGDPSSAFTDLINSLLVKDPAKRMQWPELCTHAFWRTKHSSVPLPSQPAFTNMIELSSKPNLSERNTNRQPHDRTPPRHRNKETKGTSRQDENLVPGSRCYETPVKGLSSGRKTPSKTPHKPTENNQREAPSATKVMNLLRLSRIAKSNLQRENDRENYRRPQPNATENAAEVKIENNDMELDFTENVEDEPNEEPDDSDAAVSIHDREMNFNHSEGNAENTTKCHPESAVVANDSEVLAQEPTAQSTNDASAPPPATPQAKTQRAKIASDHGTDCGSSKPSTNLADVLWHPSDLSVRPVMPSRKADKLSDTIPSLPFDAVAVSEFVKKPKEQLDAFVNKIVMILNGNLSVLEKQNVIKYLEMLSSNVDAANILSNGPVMLVLVKMLRQPKASALRVQVASVVGLLIRYSTFIDDNLASSGILGSLTEGLRDKQEKVRRFSMAALGELLFYISTQNEQNGDPNAPESLPKDNRPTSGWQVPNASFSLVSSILRKGEDDITQLYALRTIENIFSQGRPWVARFACSEVINNLCYMFRAAGKQESIRLTAGSCLVRLLRFNSPGIQSAIDKLSLKDMASALVKGNPKEQQINLNLLNIVMLGSHTFTNIGRHLLPLAEDKNLGRDDLQITLLRVLESCIEEPSAILECGNIFVCEILPSLSVLYKGNKDGDARFLCSKILFGVVVVFLNEPTADAKSMDELRSIANNQFLPLYPTFIEDEDPIPMYAQKLLVMLIEFDYIKIADILRLKTTVQRCFGFLLGDLSNANVNNVKLCLALASAPELETKVLSQLKVVRRIGNLLEFVNAKGMEDFMEPTLGLCRAFLLRSGCNRKCFNTSKEPMLLSDNPEPMVVDQQQCIRDIADFGSNFGLFMELTALGEPSVADLASECMVLLMKVAPREATTCLLANLSKVGSILESPRPAVSCLLVRRTLHALGYACRQYVSHAMILAIPVAEISKLKALLSVLKKSSIPEVATASSLAGLELDRLPRFM